MNKTCAGPPTRNQVSGASGSLGRRRPRNCRRFAFNSWLMSGYVTAFARPALGLQRIDNVDKWESIEIGIARANPRDPVFAHDNHRVCIMKEVAGKMR